MAKNPIKFYLDLLVTFTPLVLLIVAGFWIASKFIAPPVPKHITISTGNENGAYYYFAEKYRDELKKNGITLDIISSSGSLENIERLQHNKADIAFIQGGTATEEEGLVSLGSLYYEPVWIFVNSNITIRQLKDFSGLRISTGPDGSGTQVIAQILLGLNEINGQNSSLVAHTNDEAADYLLDHKIDVAFFVASAKTPVIQKLFHDNRVYLLNLERAKAYSLMLSYLSEISLAEGIVDLPRNIPNQAISLIAPTANLIVRDDLHSALQVLLLEAAKKIHSGPGLFSPAGEFPTVKSTVTPVSEIAERYFKVGPPFLMRYLPFSVAIFIDRMIVLLIPLLALMLPLIKIIPPLYRWRVRSNIYRRYNELQKVENKIFDHPLTMDERHELTKELERIETEVISVKTPLSYADQLYNLLMHIDLVKKKIKAEKSGPQNHS
jgi:TRAP transporter TAXI family solute receptor